MDQGQTVLVDNASIGKAYEVSFKNMKADAIVEWLEARFDEGEHDERVVAAKIAFNMGHQLQQASGGCIGMAKTEYKKWLIKFISDRRLRQTRLEKLAETFDMRIRFLPAHYFETNPIEGFWRGVKPKFRDLPRSMPWEERLKQAYEDRISEKLQKRLVHESIKWCLARHERFKAEGPSVRSPAPKATDEVVLVDPKPKSRGRPARTKVTTKTKPEATTEAKSEPAAQPAEWFVKFEDGLEFVFRNEAECQHYMRCVHRLEVWPDLQEVPPEVTLYNGLPAEDVRIRPEWVHPAAVEMALCNPGSLSCKHAIEKDGEVVSLHCDGDCWFALKNLQYRQCMECRLSRDLQEELWQEWRARKAEEEAEAAETLPDVQDLRAAEAQAEEEAEAAETLPDVQDLLAAEAQAKQPAVTQAAPAPAPPPARPHGERRSPRLLERMDRQAAERLIAYDAEQRAARPKAKAKAIGKAPAPIAAAPPAPDIVAAAPPPVAPPPAEASVPSVAMLMTVGDPDLAEDLSDASDDSDDSNS